MKLQNLFAMAQDVVDDAKVQAIDLLDRVGLQPKQKPSLVKPIIWLTAGLVVGGSVALMFAPATGDITRRQLAKFAARGLKLAQKEAGTVHKLTLAAVA